MDFSVFLRARPSRRMHTPGARQPVQHTAGTVPDRLTVGRSDGRKRLDRKLDAMLIVRDRSVAVCADGVGGRRGRSLRKRRCGLGRSVDDEVRGGGHVGGSLSRVFRLVTYWRASSNSLLTRSLEKCSEFVHFLVHVTSSQPTWFLDDAKCCDFLTMARPTRAFATNRGNQAELDARLRATSG